MQSHQMIENELFPNQIRLRYAALLDHHLSSVSPERSRVGDCHRELGDLLLKIEGFARNLSSSNLTILLNDVFREDYYSSLANLVRSLRHQAGRIGLLENALFSNAREEDLQYQVKLLQLISNQILETFSKYAQFDTVHVQTFFDGIAENVNKFLKKCQYDLLTAEEETLIRKEGLRFSTYLLTILSEKKKSQYQQRGELNRRAKEIKKLRVSFRNEEEAITSPTSTTTSSFSSKASEAENEPMTNIHQIKKLIPSLSLPCLLHKQEDASSVSMQKTILDFTLPRGLLILDSLQSHSIGKFGSVKIGKFRDKWKIFLKSIPSKEINFQVTKTAPSASRIENELIILRGLGWYPTILNCYGCVLEGSFLQVIYQLPHYGSLGSILAEQTVASVPTPLAVAWMYDLADALQFLHSHGVVHQQVNAENCLLFDSMQIKLSNFRSSYLLSDRIPLPAAAAAATASSATVSSTNSLPLQNSQLFSQYFQVDMKGFWNTTFEILSRWSLEKISNALQKHTREQVLLHAFMINNQYVMSHYDKLVASITKLLKSSFDADGGKSISLKVLSKELFNQLEVSFTGDPRDRNNLRSKKRIRIFENSISKFTISVSPDLALSDSNRKKANVSSMMQLIEGFTRSFPSFNGHSSSTNGKSEKEKVFVIDNRRRLVYWLMQNANIKTAVAEEVALVLLKQGLYHPTQMKREYDKDPSLFNQVGDIDETIKRKIIQNLA